MSEEWQSDEQSARSSESNEQPVRHAASGCLSAFVVLWGIAFVMVGLLITGVSGYCSIVVFSSGGAGDFGGLLVGGVLLGLFLCGLGYIMMRRN